MATSTRPLYPVHASTAPPPVGEIESTPPDCAEETPVITTKQKPAIKEKKERSAEKDFIRFRSVRSTTETLINI